MSKIRSNKYLSEGFVAITFYFTLFLCLAFFSKTNLGTYIIVAASSLVLFVCMCFFYEISGCHINPIVSFALLINKTISLKEFWKYVLAQFVGAAVSGLFVLIIYLIVKFQSGLYQLYYACDVFGSTSILQFNIFGTIIVEFILSFVFVSVYLFASINFKSKVFISLSISLCFCVVMLFGFPLSTACINPIRSIVSAIVFGIPSGSFMPMLQSILFIIVPVSASFCCVKFFAVFLNRQKKEVSSLKSK